MDVAERPLAVLHFDAHCDTWEDHFSEPSGHGRCYFIRDVCTKRLVLIFLCIPLLFNMLGTWVYEAFQEGLVIPECFTQMGIRSSGEKDTLEYVSGQGGQIFSGRDLRGLENASQLKEVKINYFFCFCQVMTTMCWLPFILCRSVVYRLLCVTVLRCARFSIASRGATKIMGIPPRTSPLISIAWTQVVI